MNRCLYPDPLSARLSQALPQRCRHGYGVWVPVADPTAVFALDQVSQLHAQAERLLYQVCSLHAWDVHRVEAPGYTGRTASGIMGQDWSLPVPISTAWFLP